MGENSNEMSVHGETGNYREFSTSGFNERGENVIVKDYLMPAGMDMNQFIKEDTNYITGELVQGCQDLGYSVEEEDRVVGVMLTRATQNGAFPSDKGLSGNQGFHHDAEAALIRRGNTHKLLLKHRANFFYVETGRFLNHNNGNYYNARLHIKDSEGKVRHELFVSKTNYDKKFLQEENLSRDIASLIGVTLKRARRVDYNLY